MLRDGPQIQASVLKETEQAVFVDLGYDVLVIPRRVILEIQQETPEAQANASQVRTTDDLYSTANLPPASVKQLVDRFGEGVGLVTSPSGLGSGFFITREGHLITNFHVVEGEQKLAVLVFRQVGNEFRRDKYEDVDIVALNPFLDLALLKVNLPDDEKPVITYLADDDTLRDGDPVFAIGNPHGLERTVTEGIVGRRNRANEGLVYIQTTAQINPGNSGGPLFNARGEVVGVIKMKISRAEGLAFAIPIRYAKDFLRNRDAFVYDSASSLAGYRYLQPPERLESGTAPILKTNP